MTDEIPNSQTVKLSLRRILWDAFALPFAHRASLARATGLPLLAIIACFLVSSSMAPDAGSASSWGLYFLYIIAISWLAIVVHRLVLLDSPVSSTPIDRPAILRLAKFVGALAGVWVIFAGATLLIVSGFVGVFFSRHVSAGSPPPPPLMPFDWINNLAVVAALWFAARFSLIFPAIATDEKFDPMESWRHSRGNGWKLAVVFGVLPWSMQQLTGFLYRDGASLVEFGLLVLVSALVIIVEVVALSLSYSALTTPAQQPTHPPA